MMPSSCNGSFSRMATNVPTPSPVFSWRRMRSRGGGLRLCFLRARACSWPQREKRGQKRPPCMHGTEKRIERAEQRERRRRGGEGDGKAAFFFLYLCSCRVFFFFYHTFPLSLVSHIFPFFFACTNASVCKKAAETKTKGWTGASKKKK